MGTDDYHKLHIKIEHVTRFSFGQYDDGKAVVWAAGKCGWYEIIPGPQYHTHYADIAEAINLFYFLVDQRMVSGHSTKGCDIPTFCREYQKEINYRVDDEEEALGILDKHYKFLMQQMFSNAEKMRWGRTYVWNYLSCKFADFAARLEGVTSGTTETSQEEVEALLDPPIASSDEDEVDWGQFLLEVLQTLRVNGTTNGRDCNIDKLREHLDNNVTFHGSGKDAFQIVNASAGRLVAWMDEKKFRRSLKPIYDQLKSILASGVVAGGLTTPASKLNKHPRKSGLRPTGQSGRKKRTLDITPPPAETENEVELTSSPNVDISVTRCARIGASALSEQTNRVFMSSAYPGPEKYALVRIVQEEGEKGGRRGATSHLEEYILSGGP